MVPALSIEAKSALIETARCLWNRDISAAFVHLNRLSPQLKSDVCGRLEKATSLMEKIQAVEDVLCKHFPIHTPPSSPKDVPLGAKPIEIKAWYDCGFDPRFSFEGDFLLPSQDRSWTELSWHWAAYLEFQSRSYCSMDPNERKLRQLLLACAKAELAWSKTTLKTFTVDFDHTNFSVMRERDFLDSVSNLFHFFHPETTGRLYPDEALTPIHSINCPQGRSFDKRRARPKWENFDLRRTVSAGFWRLNSEMYSQLDPIEYNYVPHYLFIHAVQTSSEKLKNAIREFRTEIAATIVDSQCARLFSILKERIIPKLDAFHAAWTDYINSHDVLQEVQAIFSRQDHFCAYYEYFRAQNFHSFSALVSNWEEKMKMQKQETCLFDQAYESVKHAVLQEFPHTLSGRLLATIERKP